MKKTLALIIAIAMVIGTMSGIAFAEETTVSVWDGTTATTAWYDNSTSTTEYHIYSASDLAGLSKILNEWDTSNNPFQGATIYLECDIDLANHEWIPIGLAKNSKGREHGKWHGSFDGKNHTISNLKISTTYQHAALFSYTGGGQQSIKNLTVHNASVTNTYTSKPATAVIVGRINSNSFELSNVSVTGTINLQGSQFAGAIAGYGRGKVENCKVEATGTISTTSNDVGGLIGIYYPANENTYVSNCEVKGTGEGLKISGSYYTGGAIGLVSDADAMTHSVVSDIEVSNLEVASTSSNAAYVACGYAAANSYVADVTTTVKGEVVAGKDAETVTKYVAQIGDNYYATLQAAVNAVSDNTTIKLIGTVSGETVKLPAVLRNFAIEGQGNIVENTTINAFDGGSIDYQGFSVKNTIFENSRFVLGGQRAGNVIYKDLVFEGNTFRNIVNAASLAAIHMNLASKDSEYIENFTFKNNVVDGVSGASNSGIVMKEVKGDVVIEGNTMRNIAWNAIQVATAKPTMKLVIKNNEFQSNGSSVVNIAAAPSVVLENNIVTPAEGKIGIFFPSEAKIGEALYPTLQKAIDAADAGDVVTLTTDVSAVINPTADSTNSADNCIVSIPAGKTVTLDLNGKTISAKGSDDAKYDTVAVKNYGNLTIVDSGASRSAGTITLAFDGTQEVGTSQIHSTILNFGTLTVNGGNIINTATSGKARYAIYNYSWGGNVNTTINGGFIDSKSTLALYTSAYDDHSRNVCNVTINGGTIDGVWYSNTGATAGASLAINGGEFNGDYDDTAVTIIEPTVGKTILAITGGNFVKDGYDSVEYFAGDDTVAKFISGGKFSSNVSAYAAEGFDVVRTADGYVVEGEVAQADSISVEYKDITAADAEGEKTYEIVVKANDGDSINELASADLTFVYTTAPAVGGAIDFTVAPAKNFSMSRVDKTNRYMFNYDGVGAFEGSGNAITIGTIKVEGYGKFTIATKEFDATETDTNIVNATTINDNLVDSYTAAGAKDTDATTGALVINKDTVANDGMVGSITNGAIAVPTRELTINIAFPNAVEDNVIAYQDMMVEITGNIDGVNKTETYNLGEDEIAMVDGKYVVTEDRLVLNNAYTVTVSGAGYRTARYTVTMTNDKELNFWNNVMDEEKEVEVGKDSSKTTKNFLAGDIVKDNNINIYDLSAVVSYFASTSNVENGYAKYDLNRDGVIDSKDVAYVLVSWNN